MVALRCLGILPQVVRYDILHPYKTQVIRVLGDCLDDPKRDVRKEAVDARSIRLFISLIQVCLLPSTLGQIGGLLHN